MQAILIINPVSGDAEPNSAKLPDILRLLSPAPFEVIVRETTLETSAGDLAKTALAEGHTIILVGGGDGTVSEVAAALVNQRQATLGVIPIGTFNNMARSFEIAPELENSCGIIAAGHTKSVDVGLANDKTTFFEAAGSGLDATLFPVGEELKSGQWSRIFSLVKLAVQFKRRTFSIRMTTDGAVRAIRRRALLVVVANGPYYGGGFTVAHDASLTDGLLTLCIYRKFSKWELLRHFYSISRGKKNYSPKVETYHAGEIEIRTRRRVPVHIDGKPSGTTPYSFRTLNGALTIFAPERPLTEEEEIDPPISLPGSGENQDLQNKDKKAS